jgi:dTMP kinase
MFAARATHLENLVIPAVRRGAWVLCDRFTDATYAYQGGGRRLPMGQIDALVQMVHAGVQPDLTFLLDLPVEVGLARARERNGTGGPDRFETEQREFFERVRATYLERARSDPGRFRVIDAAAAVDEVADAVRGELGSLLEGSR